MRSTVLVTGGGGYIGCRLVPALLAAGYQVRVVDRFLFGRQALDAVAGAARIIAADIRDRKTVATALDGVDAVIHLAAFSNDPSAELDEAETRSVNGDAVYDLHSLSVDASVQRFINASSASVYGVRAEEHVVETTPCTPVSLYARLKLETDRYLALASTPATETVSLRSATVAGYSPRMRLDLTANIFAAQVAQTGVITVHGGQQSRPMVHIDDLVATYIFVLEADAADVAGKVFNVGTEVYPVLEIAEIVRDQARARGLRAQIERSDEHDSRSYRLDSRALSALGCRPQRGLATAVGDVLDRILDGSLPKERLGGARYRNVETLVEQGFGK